MTRPALLTAAALLLLLATWGRSAPGGPGDRESRPETVMDSLAEAYVKLVLAVGHHDADYVDAYYGPAAWRDEVAAEPPSLDEIRARASALLGELATVPPADAGELERLRRGYLETQLRSLRARLDQLAGQVSSFDEEALALYGVEPPRYADEHFQRVLAELAPLLPGDGSMAQRFEAFQQRFMIPAERLDAVFRAAIETCRERTAQHLELPEGESFEVEYVTGKSWSAYNWYQGGYQSLIQLNTDQPVPIDRAVQLACHEGYPGHHAYNSLLEKHLVRDRGWIEFSVYALFSPQSLIAEGTADYGIELAFPGDDRLDFERRVLFPLAGLDPEEVERYYRVREMVERLAYADNEAARRHLAGEIDAAETAAYLARFKLMSPGMAERRVRFIEQYRSYVINYNLGEDLVRRHVESRAQTLAERWKIFGELLSSPRLPQDL